MLVVLVHLHIQHPTTKEVIIQRALMFKTSFSLALASVSHKKYSIYIFCNVLSRLVCLVNVAFTMFSNMKVSLAHPLVR